MRMSHQSLEEDHITLQRKCSSLRNLTNLILTPKNTSEIGLVAQSTLFGCECQMTHNIKTESKSCMRTELTGLKLNDELSSPEKKSRRSDFRETRSGPSSTHSSPERSGYRNGGSGEEWSRERLRERFTSSDRKCASLPSSPERRVLLQYNDADKRKQGDVTLQGNTGEPPNLSNCHPPKLVQ
ncbi:hypothetical protein CRUP_021558 [Coryphaenoides rupestris]|nr:hypothetical protein CRUP_021558 [Coryphaenoides rupestris]